MDSDKDSVGAASDVETDDSYGYNIVTAAGDAVFLACEDSGYGGTIFAAGGVFCSDFEVDADVDDYDLGYANTNIITNILKGVQVQLDVTPIAEVREVANTGATGDVFRVQGYVTAGTANSDTVFFDCIYIQDETGGMDLQVEILSGRYQGDVVNVSNYFSALYNVKDGVGDKVSIRTDTTSVGEYTASVYNYYRVPGIIGCIAIFVLLLILIGGKKGAKSVIGLAFDVVCILWILLPLSLKGYSPLLVTILIALAGMLLTFFLIDGVQTKTVAASVGSMCGVLAGAGFSLTAQAILSVTTYQMDEAETLLLITSTTDLHLDSLFLCGVLIACLGAVMDVAMSIASSVAEVHAANPRFGMRELFHSGMNVGRDAMGTMSNTLILVYAGSALNMMLMIYSYGVSFQQLMNTDFVAIEIICCAAGSTGIICTVPFVAVVTAAALT
ncbi:MAG: YibE/F family protein, partial [Clostridiales bacterium]|nr:YibE/F family protein [Clostridiales bacterium]